MTKDDLLRFCADRGDIRHYLADPWSRGDYTYATNGHIIVRNPRLADVPENDYAPNTEKLMLSIPPATDWTNVPTVDMPPDKDCVYCNGIDVCDDCGGTGKMPDLSGIALFGTFFAKRYLALIQGWEIAPNGQKAAWIRTDDADGLLMPRSGL